MDKYITILDLRSKQCYKNTVARLVYLHVACSVDVSTYNYVCSIRRLAGELGLTVQSIRTALRQLVDEGLVTTELVTHQSTRGLTHQLTQPLTQIHVMRINEIDAASNAASNTAANTAANTPSNTQKNNLNNKNNKNPPLTDARVAWAEKQKILENSLNLDEAAAAEMVATFRQRQQLKKKTWEDDGDLTAHLIAFAEKRIASIQRAQPKPDRSDHGARIAERQRAREASEGTDEKVKAWEEVQTVWRWWKEAEKKAATMEDEEEKGRLLQHAAAQHAAYEELAAEWKVKYLNKNK